MTRKQSFDVKIGDSLTYITRNEKVDFVVTKINEAYDYNKNRPYRDYFYDSTGRGYYYQKCHNPGW